MGIVTVQPWKVHGRKRWAVYRRVDGKRKMSFFDTRDAAEAEAIRVREEISSCGKAWIALPPSERTALMLAWARAKEKGLDLLKLVEADQKPACESISISKVISEMIESKRSSGRSERYISSVQIVLDQFANGREEMAVASIGLVEVERYLESKKLASRSTLRARLSTLFKFAVRRGYRSDNPCARLEPVTVHRPPPAIFTLDQFSKCLQWLRRTRGGGFPWFVLSSCCGLRPEEAEKTRKADIHFKEGWIKVEAQTSKVRQRRVVYPKPEAMRLLKAAVSRGRLPITTQARRRTIRGLRKHLGWLIWPKDITRHTAASYWLASSQSASAVAESLGTAETTLKKHYKALVTKADAAKFWKALTF